MRNNTLKTLSVASTLLGTLLANQAQAAIALDRTRIIFNGGEKATSLNISNKNTQLPYLAQGWLEDAQGNKITSPLVVLPPVQRLEPGAKSQIKVQALPAANLLAQDRESLFYFNLREIPPKSDKPNTLQIALQTRIKLFYRPAAIIPGKAELATPWQEKLTLTLKGKSFQVNNPTPYYITLVAASSKEGKVSQDFTPQMVPPKGSIVMSAADLGNSPVLTYVNDYGGRPTLTFKCGPSDCKVIPDNKE
jgi:P pilus assembly chaperone PapD